MTVNPSFSCRRSEPVVDLHINPKGTPYKLLAENTCTPEDESG
jgi:hypothetical protein